MSEEPISSTRNKTASILALIGGSLLVIGGGKGMVDILNNIQTYANELFEANPLLILIFKILIFFAMLGGISVILGGVLLWKNWPKLGRFLIFLGAGMGLIGLCFAIIISYMGGGGDGVIGYFQDLMGSLTGVGVIFTIISSLISK